MGKRKGETSSPSRSHNRSRSSSRASSRRSSRGRNKIRNDSIDLKSSRFHDLNLNYKKYLGGRGDSKSPRRSNLKPLTSHITRRIDAPPLQNFTQLLPTAQVERQYREYKVLTRGQTSQHNRIPLYERYTKVEDQRDPSPANKNNNIPNKIH